VVNFSISRLDNKVEVRLEGDLDIEGTEVIEDELLPSLIKYKSVIINFKDVLFVDSTGMGLLINLVNTLQEKGSIISIVNVREEVMEVFDLLQLPEILGKGCFV
jgi:anti-anti-sigma factor